MYDYTYGTVLYYESAPVYRDISTRRIVGHLYEGDNVIIDTDRSNDRYYYVITETSIEGFCMRKYIEVA